MKIALCISGQPRVVEHGYKCLEKNLIKDHNVDTFIHTWYDKTITSTSEYGGGFTFNENVKQEILDLYTPVSSIFEPPINTLPGYDSRNTSMHYAQYCMFYGIKAANDLKLKYEQSCSFKYDVVIRTRFDAGLLQPIDFDNLNTDTLYSIDAINNSEVYCDWLLYGDSKTLDKVCNLYNDINEIKKNIKPFCGEELLAYHLKSNNIECQKTMINNQGNNLVLIRETQQSADKSNCWLHYTEL